MRKLFFLMGLFFVLPLSVAAEGIEAGKNQVNLYLETAFGLDRTGVEFTEGKDYAWGNAGVGMGLSYLYYPSSHLGIGIDGSIKGFQGTKREEWYHYGHHWYMDEAELTMQQFQLLGAARLYLNPESRVRLYVPLGAGISIVNGEMEYKSDYYWDRYEENYTSTSFAYYAGVGLEFETNNGLAFGLEARYNAFDYNMGKLADRVGAPSSVGKEKYEYVSLLFTVGF